MTKKSKVIAALVFIFISLIVTVVGCTKYQQQNSTLKRNRTTVVMRAKRHLLDG
ncbi:MULTISPECIES: hypothetical protein [unclassified Enterococcus]|uniref:hypothetical protein n=1 Tax=unclassified Enterococcus TaxID=2608891 RepID=UPI0013EB0339|nr:MULTISPECIES: hypothetical protein [unclassified Enterococcus]